MYSPLHAAAGLTIVALVPNPVLSFPLAIASHYLLDALPHGDMRKPPHVLQVAEGRRLLITEAIDMPLTALVVWKLTTIFSSLSPLYLLAGAVAGILPDILWGGKFLLEAAHLRLPGLTRVLDVHHRWHEWIHVKAPRDIPFYAGVAYHLAVVILLLSR